MNHWKVLQIQVEVIKLLFVIEINLNDKLLIKPR